ncbi:phosphoadenylyl-sulfate reductase [Parabacteroides sp. Marseille-P3160]|uniref:phosphoadenylyl-sulfate reductase n=1 Tax=Parabacteroides sp. Marseille-P3160 TaxID=1917887 RepID=UPI0009BA157D|nr:phosphoadenylyl-sulfate reductase [Parabacteroides sp. Marseille-P3160]
MDESSLKEQINQLNETFNKQSPEAVLSYFLKEHKGRVALASSLGLEDQVLTDMILNLDPSARIFTIDTGRLFPETYSLIDKTNMRYNTKIEVFCPDYRNVEPFVKKYGVNSFYESVERRKECCRVRKIEPLLRALSSLDAWICGLRQEQSVTRVGEQIVEWDKANGLIKVNPLVFWTEQQVWDYIKERNVPYNKLHDRGFPSIGCQPCTRAVAEGEDIRAGRWWWEDPKYKECGLHRR